MDRAVYTIAAGSVAAMARLDIAAHNLANVTTVGYKAERVVFRLPSARSAAVAPGTVPARRVEAVVLTDLSQGPIRRTGNPLDVALSGRGFFVVATPRGERLTRQGNFHVRADGTLVTAGGMAVLGESGEIRLRPGRVSVASDGTLSVGGVVAGRLRIVDVPRAEDVVPEGAGLYRTAGDVTPEPVPAGSVEVLQGALEQANVDPVGTLVELVDVARGFESYVQAVRRMDELAQRSITEGGRF